MLSTVVARKWLRVADNKVRPQKGIGAVMVISAFVGYTFAMAAQKLELVVSCAVVAGVGMAAYLFGRWTAWRLPK